MFNHILLRVKRQKLRYSNFMAFLMIMKNLQMALRGFIIKMLTTAVYLLWRATYRERGLLAVHWAWPTQPAKHHQQPVSFQTNAVEILRYTETAFI
ncbi:hypothetical protein Y71_04880 [Kosakonia radicincitans DSM 16656]|nr:hypothetical protein A3780_19220 [Kosakonia radicincitans]ARD59288.1 hypothetical protein Y71_04880 [Kosakonia radicincitans DSM 16656]